MPMSHEVTISCNKDKCKTTNLTSDPWDRSVDAVTDVESKALVAGWKCEDVHARIYLCPNPHKDPK